MQVQFKIKPKGADALTVTAELVDVIAWEEHFQRPSSALGGEEIFARDYVWLAWHAAKRQDKTSMEFMDWVASLEDVEGEPDAPLEPSENPPVIG
jgi:hypothetical protein